MTSDHDGVPFLEDIPFIGGLFSKSSDFISKTETVVVIRPQIIRQGQFPLITDESRAKIEQFNRKIDKDAKDIDEFLDRK
jgi:type II secretory pathway component GspD/PulD (secretin)